MATEAAQLKRKKLYEKNKTNLTLTSLLMEGLGVKAPTTLSGSLGDQGA